MANLPQVDSNVPLPNPGEGGRAPIYPWREMQVGDSFAIPLTGERHRSGNDLARVRLQTAAAKYSKNHGSRFTLRVLSDEGVVRCWRVK